MKNIARLLLYLVASAAIVAAATVAEQMPQGITVGKGQTLELTDKTIQTPSVTVESGGTLILHGTTLLMDGTTVSPASIWAKSGAAVQILNGSNVTSANGNGYTFWVDSGSAFEMRDGEISKCGVEGPTERNRGLYVQANNAVIENNVLGDNYYCLFLIGTQSAQVIDNKFNGCEMQAIKAQNAGFTQMSSNYFSINDQALYSVILSSCLNTVVSNNLFENAYGLGLAQTNASAISSNNFTNSEGPSIGLIQGSDSKENILEENIMTGRLDISGISNTVKGGSVGSELNVHTGANSNKFDGVKFMSSNMVLNSQTTSGTAFDNNVFDGTQFTEDNAVITLESNNTVHKATFGKNVSIIMTGIQNVVDNVTIQDCAGILIGSQFVQGIGALNTLSNSMIVLNFASGHGIVCEGPCLIANNTITDTVTLAQQATEREASLTGLVVAREAGLAASSVPETAAPKQQTSNGVQAAFPLIVLLGAAALFAFWTMKGR